MGHLEFHVQREDSSEVFIVTGQRQSLIKTLFKHIGGSTRQAGHGGERSEMQFSLHGWELVVC